MIYDIIRNNTNYDAIKNNNINSNKEKIIIVYLFMLLYCVHDKKSIKYSLVRSNKQQTYDVHIVMKLVL